MNYDVFLKLGNVMVENKIYTFIFEDAIKLPIEECKIRYELKLNQQLVELSVELDELETNIIDLENKNKILNIFLNNKFGKSINYKMHSLNSEKLRVNEHTLLHINEYKQLLEEIIERIIHYKTNNS
jgi:hypothetical protein